MNLHQQKQSRSNCNQNRLIGIVALYYSKYAGVSVAAAWTTKTLIVVCQNKDCRQRWQLQTPLPEVMHDLLSGRSPTTTTSSNNKHDFSIETTSCFSQCGQGPNVCITVQQQPEHESQEVYLNGLSNAIAVSAELELLSLSVPSKLLAAVNVFERAQNGRSPPCLFLQRQIAGELGQRLQFIESPTTVSIRNAVGLFGAIWSQY
jgi:predicted metal-binding protein